jgi:hypothetical protein
MKHLAHGSVIGLDAPQKRGAPYITARAPATWLRLNVDNTYPKCNAVHVERSALLRYGLKFGGIGGSSRISVMVTRRLAAI